jgi:hypothetical protein
MGQPFCPNATDTFLKLHGVRKGTKVQIKQQKMKYFGHIKHHEGLEKRIMEGYIPGRRLRGRPKRMNLAVVKNSVQFDNCYCDNLAALKRAFSCLFVYCWLQELTIIHTCLVYCGGQNATMSAIMELNTSRFPAHLMRRRHMNSHM